MSNEEVKQVYVLTLAGRHGNDVSVHRTEKGVREAVYEYVAESWSDWFGEELIPADIEEAIDKYYDTSLDEDYSVDIVGLQD